jgi:DNA repair exonuclease SbcCD nuclease subunit
LLVLDIILNSTKACCVSDIHIGVHQNHSQWHNITLQWARWLADDLKSKNVSDIIISGDVFHYRDEIAVNTMHFVTEVLQLWEDFNIIMLVGNHDAYYKDRSDINSLSILNGWKNVQVIQQPITTAIFGKVTTFCPWGTKVNEIPKSDVIFGHFEIKSFKQNGFKVCNDGMSVRDLLDRSNLIISGHFHLRDERKYDSGTILYLGNPFQMDFGDVDQSKGYYILDFNTLEYEFTPNTLSPEHKKIYLSNLVEIGSITDEVKEDFKNNFVRLIIDKNISPDEVDIVLTKLLSLNPRSINVDYSANFNKYKLDESNRADFSGIDIKTAIEEFVNLLEIENKKDVTEYTLELYRKCV